MTDQTQAPAIGGGEAPAELPEQKVVVPATAPETVQEIRNQPETEAPAVKTNAAELAISSPETKPATEVKSVEAIVAVPEPKIEDTIKPVEPAPVIPEVKLAQVAAATKEITPVEDANTVEGNWQEREAQLLKKIEELEKVKSEAGTDGMKLELKIREEEIDLLKARVKNLETELQAALSKPGAKNHEMIENIKRQHEELLSKARGMIFDKTKMVKNQELQIEALLSQVQSLKDINLITKDLLEIRNSECKAMEDRLVAMEARFVAEKERFSLVVRKAETGTALNDDLKKEYETQLGLFKELRVKYEERVQALVLENTRLKELRAAQAEANRAANS